MARILEREVIETIPYCSYCNEEIKTKLLVIKDENGEYKACPNCNEVITNV